MKIADLPINEKERLTTLFSYGILDTEHEKVFDNLTILASEICECPIAMISLVDANRQWFKSRIGINIDCTTRDVALCAHAILQDEIFEICDTLLDERFADNPLVTTSPQIRFYAGAPLKSSSGLNIGTICVASDRPKSLNSNQKRALDTLASSVMSQLELKLQNTKLILANSYKQSFLSNVSHEVRTPLNAIIGLSDLMSKNSELAIQFPAVASNMSKIDYSGKQMLKTINALLEIGKIDAGVLDLEITQSNISDYIKFIVNNLMLKANEKSIKFDVQLANDIPLTVKIDEAKFGCILSNIINNAIKFSHANSTVVISASILRDTLLLKVTDTGIGIHSEKIPYLFNQFAQITKQQGSESAGLGLSITKGLVELMSGHIDVQSELHVGTTITISLPFETVDICQTSNKSTNYQIHNIPENLNVLVVEDNKVNQAVIAALLNAIPVQFTIVGTGEEGVTLGSNNDFDLILMDIHLPGINGIEATRRLRAKNVQTPIFALTADVYRSNREKALFDSFLTKPIALDQLVEAINDNLLSTVTT